MRDKLAMNFSWRELDYRACSDIHHPAVLQQEGRSKRLPFIKRGTLRDQGPRPDPKRWLNTDRRHDRENVLAAAAAA